MSLIGSVSGLQQSLFSKLSGPGKLDGADSPLKPEIGGAIAPSGTPSTSFGNVFEQLVSAVDAKQTEAQAITKKVLLGQTDQLHQSVISMQEAGVAFQLMVEVRNKLVDSYQELMRMPV